MQIGKAYQNVKYHQSSSEFTIYFFLQLYLAWSQQSQIPEVNIVEQTETQENSWLKEQKNELLKLRDWGNHLLGFVFLFPFSFSSIHFYLRASCGSGRKTASVENCRGQNSEAGEHTFSIWCSGSSKRRSQIPLPAFSSLSVLLSFGPQMWLNHKKWVIFGWWTEKRRSKGPESTREIGEKEELRKWIP